MIKQRSYAEIQKEQLQYEAINTIASSTNSILENFVDYDAGEFSKVKQNKYKGICLQRLIKEMYSEYGSKCNIPEVRYQIFPNGNVTLHVMSKKQNY